MRSASRRATGMAVADEEPRKGTVVLLSDDDHLREALLFGSPNGVEISFAKDAREAWKLMTSSVPSVLVGEIRSGSAGAVGLARDMSQHRLLKDVPILMLLERGQDEWLARQAGAHKTLVQPVGSEALITETLALMED